MKWAMLVLLAVVGITLSECVGNSYSSTFYNRKDAAFSSNGSVPRGEKAFSPNGKYYAREFAPFDEGNIGIFTRAGKLVQKWDLLPNNNDLKGLAFSPNSKRLAVMYHGGMTPAIQVVELGKKDVVAATDIDTWYHFMVYGKDNKTLLLSESWGGTVKKLKPKEL